MNPCWLVSHDIQASLPMQIGMVPLISMSRIWHIHGNDFHFIFSRSSSAKGQPTLRISCSTTNSAAGEQTFLARINCIATPTSSYFETSIVWKCSLNMRCYDFNLGVYIVNEIKLYRLRELYRSFLGRGCLPTSIIINKNQVCPSADCLQCCHNHLTHP